MNRGNILFCMQFCKLDEEPAYELIKLMTDVVVANGKGQAPVDLMLATRFDTTINMEKAMYAAKAFRAIRTYTCPSQVTGWPDGPNALAYGVYRYFASQCTSKRFKYEAIFLMEPDSVPLRLDFIDRIVSEWHSHNRAIMGFHVKPDKAIGHINGNMIIRNDFGNICRKFGSGPLGHAWDDRFKKELVGNAFPSKEIYSDYRIGTPENPWRGRDSLFGLRGAWPDHPHANDGQWLPSWLHGVKCWKEAHVCVREELLNEQARKE